MKQTLNPPIRILTINVMLIMIVSCSTSPNKTNIKMEIQLRDQLKTAASDFFRLLEERDMEKWIDLWAEDGIDRKPYATGMFPEEINGRNAVYDAWKGIAEVFDSVSFPIQEIIVDEESRTVVVRLDGKGVMKNSNLYQNTYIFLIHYNEDLRIKECFEYFNPYVAGKAFGKLDQLKY
ncbi:MAG: nuclear transport factor 2 family protein [Bacteroidales bacterium]